jgi:hypothetical protein
MRSQSRSCAALCAAALSLVACQHAAPVPQQMPPQQVETGSTFTLLAPLAFSPTTTELLFQNQKIVGAQALARNMPYCRLAPQVGAPRAIAPGNLTVGSVTYDERESSSSGSMLSITRIALAVAANQPGYILSCGWPEATAAPSFVNTEQIFDAISGHFTMQLLR